MKNRIKLLMVMASLSVALSAGPVSADEVRSISCTPPTHRDDGKPMEPGEIQGYRWFINGGHAKNSTGCFVTLTLPVGTSNVQATTVNKYGTESVSKSVGKLFTVAGTTPPPTPEPEEIAAPNPPTNLMEVETETEEEPQEPQ